MFEAVPRQRFTREFDVSFRPLSRLAQNEERK